MPIFRDSRRGFKNRAEDQVFKSLLKRGWKVTKRGWPDFIAERDGKVMVVEVKRVGQGLRGSQSFIMRRLARHMDVMMAHVGADGAVAYSAPFASERLPEPNQ
jgi:Holliday junction resolvase-like predicted endonuclease